MYILGSLCILLMLTVCEVAKGQEYEMHDVAQGTCEQVLTWRLGNIDTAFAIGRTEVKHYMEEVQTRWAEAAGHPVLAYSDTGDVVLNLVYGRAQQTTDAAAVLWKRIQQVRLNHTSLKKKYEQLLHTRTKKQVRYEETRRAVFADIKEYNDWARRIGDEGVVQDLDLEQLSVRKAKIKESKKQLVMLQDELNREAIRLGKLSARMESTAEKLNALIYMYNDRFQDARTFYQGAYIDDLNHKKIIIYEFESPVELRLLLLHEAGHALGIPHQESPRSVMHYTMEYIHKVPLRLGEDDRRAINSRCRE